MSLLTSDGHPEVHDLIAASWQRSEGYGLESWLPLDDLPAEEIDTASPLAQAAAPVLNRVATVIGNTEYVFVLSDHDGRVMDQYGRSSVRDKLMDCSVRPGVSFREERVGTNAIGMAVELRQSVTLNPGDHFNESLRDVACIAHPIIHPVTRRLVGVVDLSGDTGVTHPLVTGLVKDVVTEIENRLLASSSASQQQLLAAFRAASSRRAKPVVALDEDVLLANRSALDLLHTDDFATLQGLVPDGRGEQGTRTTRVPIELANGHQVWVTVDAVPDTRSGLLLSVEPERAARMARVSERGERGEPKTVGGRGDRRAHPSPAVATTARLVHGPHGSGRSAQAHSAAAGADLRIISAAGAHSDGGARWLDSLTRAWDAGPDVLVCVEDIELLPDPLLLHLTELLRTPQAGRLILTSAPLDTLTGRAAAVASMCPQRDALLPLAQRREEIHALALSLIAQIAPTHRLRLTPSVVRALSAHPWPGNINELRSVMAQVCARRSAGDVVLTDLPQDYRATQPARQLGGMEQAERDAIVRALALHDGNKVRAAAHLGISRTTLYARMRQLRIA